MRFLKDGEIDDDTTVSGLKEAKEKLDILSLSKEERGDYNRYISNMSYQRSVFDSAHIDGKEEGKKEGIMQERKANIIAFSKVLSPKQIAETLNIPLDEVEEILKDNK